VRVSGAFARTNERRQIERQEREFGIAEWLAQLKRAATCLVAPAEGASRSQAPAPRARLEENRRAHSLHLWMLPPLEHVVVERSLEDRRVDQTDDVLKGAQAGGLDHGLHSAPTGDDT
jgi:hypothetical protein